MRKEEESDLSNVPSFDDIFGTKSYENYDITENTSRKNGEGYNSKLQSLIKGFKEEVDKQEKICSEFYSRSWVNSLLGQINEIKKFKLDSDLTQNCKTDVKNLEKLETNVKDEVEEKKSMNGSYHEILIESYNSIITNVKYAVSESKIRKYENSKIPSVQEIKPFVIEMNEQENYALKTDVQGFSDANNDLNYEFYNKHLNYLEKQIMDLKI